MRSSVACVADHASARVAIAEGSFASGSRGHAPVENDTRVARGARRTHDRRSRRRRDGTGAPRGEPPRARAGRDRARDRAPRFDLSLESRRATNNGIVHDAAAAIREHGLGLKAATVTPEGRDDVGSPNRILREEIGGKVIVRTGRRIPGVAPLGGVHAPISIVRMAVGDAYGAKEWREGEGDDEVAFRTERIERRICHAVAEFAFLQAERTGAKVFGGPKYTVSPTYEGMLKEEMDAAAARHPDVPYEPQLIDATFALLLSSAGDPLVIPALNRDGDILSDLVLPLFGSIAGSESLLVSFGDDFEPDAIMAEAAHGTAPSLHGQERREPDGDDPRRRRAPLPCGRRGAAGRAAQSARRASKRSPQGRAPPTSAATSARRSSRTR